jgi:DNA-directed RNA polymerase specialized sigma24 family protein
MSKETPQLREREFELLLAWLDPGNEHGAQVYLNLHKRLTAVFINKGCGAPEELADETFNRVARQLAEGKEIGTDNRFAYLYGIAKNISYEHWRRWENRKREDFGREGDADFNKPPIGPDLRLDMEETEEKGRQLRCLDECLNRLAPESRLLMLEYYSEEKTEKIDTRDRMASRLGVTSGVLRNRIFKLRNTLRPCVLRCLAR